ncbi:MAG TPA: hypothetical protein VGG99_20980 [Acetobacteraceae bacterium]|jgi:hypothetical protein
MIDIVRANPLLIEKHERCAVVSQWKSVSGRTAARLQGQSDPIAPWPFVHRG